MTKTSAPSQARPKPDADLLDRVTRAIEAELAQIENILGGKSKPPRGEAERRARTLASLARTLSEVKKLRIGDEGETTSDDSVPRDLDEFRRALSRRLEQMVAPAEELPAGGNE